MTCLESAADQDQAQECVCACLFVHLCEHVSVKRACVHKVSPFKYLIVGVGSHSPALQDMKQAWRGLGPQKSRGLPNQEDNSRDKPLNR